MQNSTAQLTWAVEYTNFSEVNLTPPHHKCPVAQLLSPLTLKLYLHLSELLHITATIFWHWNCIYNKLNCLT